MKIALISDAWQPQINGVVTTWSHVRDELIALGHSFEVFHPGLFNTIPTPKYPEIRLAILPNRKLARLLDDYKPDAVHIATEGSVGLAGRGWCRSRSVPFTTSYHTKFPEYLHNYFELPTKPTYLFMRWFHRPAQRTLVPTPSMRNELIAHGFDADKVIAWTRGVNHDLFHPYPDGPDPYQGLPHPRFVYCGRVAPEKNIGAFLELELPGSMVVIGDGPSRKKLQAQFPHVHFAGYQTGEALARHFAAGDIFVFPSLTDTFGVVMIEAMACGLPVAAYPVTGPIDVVQPGVTGYLDEDLQTAALKCMDLNPQDSIDDARQYTWHNCAQMVLDILAPVRAMA